MDKTFGVTLRRTLLSSLVALAVVSAVPGTAFAEAPAITATCTIADDGTAIVSGTVSGLDPTPGNIGVFDFTQTGDAQVGFLYPVINGAFLLVTFETAVIQPGAELLVELRRGGDFSGVANTTVVCVALATSVTQVVNDLAAAGVLAQAEANSLLVKVDAATQSAERGNVNAAVNQLTAFKNEAEALFQSGRITQSEYEQIIEAVDREIADLQG